MSEDGAVAELRSRLERSRETLLHALEGLTERDFASQLAEGQLAGEEPEEEQTVIQLLATLAPAEREAIRQAREALGAPARPMPAGGSPPVRPLPPQVVHDLAGARYETLLFLDTVAATGLGRAVERQSVYALLEAIAEREEAVARQIEERPRSDVPPPRVPGPDAARLDFQPPARG